MDAESKVVAFYRGAGDDAGRTLGEILTWDHDRLEHTHDYIQWLFPLREPSLANPRAPVLTPGDVRTFRDDPALRHRMREALGVMRDFLGLEGQGFRHWLNPGNHNYLRLTRILRSLRTVGLEAEARRLFTSLTAIYREHETLIGDTTFRYWTRAMTDDLGR